MAAGKPKKKPSTRTTASRKGAAKPKAASRKPPARRRAKRAPPPMVYEEPQAVPAATAQVEAPPVPAVVAPRTRPGVFEPEVLAARPGHKRAPTGAVGRWSLPKDPMRLRCPSCGQGNDRKAAVCEHCRALL